MMIAGIGTDLIEMERVRRLIVGEQGERLIARILTEIEREQLRNKRAVRRIEHIAGRFAAKEAVSKALGCGIGRVLGWHDIEVLPDSLGKPVVRIAAEVWARLHAAKHVDVPTDGMEWVIHLSITHTSSFAQATAILERRIAMR